MDLELAGKRALVLASSQGLGFGIGAALAREGASVCLSGRSADRLAEGARQIGGHFAVCDLSEAGSAAALVAEAQDRLGGIDILVNNTGGPPPGPTTAHDAARWAGQFDTMVTRIIEVTSLCLPGMQAAGWGRVLTVTSSGVVQPIPNLAMSNTLRSALVGWSKSLALEVGGAGITSNVLVPGRIHTDRVDELDANNAKRQGTDIEAVQAASRATIPVGRYGRVQEFADTATFLVSGPASYITGSVIRCDGGLIKTV